MEKIYYFDNAATTKVSDSAASEAVRIMTELYGNPSSVHDFGYEAEKVLKSSRKILLETIGSDDRKDDFIFTSGGTEANNLAILGTLKLRQRLGKTVIFSDSEHASVYTLSRKLADSGYTVKYIPTKGGALDFDFCEQEFNDDVVLISCMYVNNETGAKYDLKKLNQYRQRLCPEAIFHSDCVQAFTKVKDPLCETGADLISVSGHKIHAPKGVGGLYIKSGVRISNIIYGGGQEKNIRSGTEALPLIAAFSKAVKETDTSANYSYVEKLREYLLNSVARKLPELTVNIPADSSPYVVSLTLPAIKSEVMLRHLSSKNIYISAGSACSSKHRENRVLAAYGLNTKQADTTVRISFSEYNTKDEIDILTEEIRIGTDTLVSMK